jgi:putative Holliday junction resolvase
MKEIKQVLSFDFGTKRIGVACGQTITGTANELPPIKAKDGIPDWKDIEQLIKEWQPDLILVGLPLNMDGSESQMSLRATKFGKRIHGMFGKQVEMIDERLTSQEVKRDWQDNKGIRDFGTHSVDGMVAKILFEDWCANHQQ